MADVLNVRAAANNEVGFISWDIDEMIPGCLGFEIVRIYPQTGEERSLASWVPFKGQRNKDWIPQDTGVWPVQKTFWRDLTLRRRRDSLELRPSGEQVRYRVRPVGDMKPGREPVPVRQDKTYTGDARPLGYLGAGAESNTLTLGSEFGNARVAFTNGVLSTQWMSRALESAGIALGNILAIQAELRRPDSKIRAYLHGEVPDVLTSLFARARAEGGKVRLALYELGDDVLCDAIIDAKDNIEVILSNSGRDADTGLWDAGNAPYRKRLRDAGVQLTSRLFNNNHIGHNKFAVYRDAQGKPQAVMTGSTNWTATGICGQSNNAFVLDDADMAEVFDGYWEDMKNDVIAPLASESTAGRVVQVQGHAFREKNHTAKVGNGWTVWFSPNDPDRTKKDLTVRPVDLDDVFARMQGARKAILFLAFNPSRPRRLFNRQRGGCRRKGQSGTDRARRHQRSVGNAELCGVDQGPGDRELNRDGKSPFVFPERVREFPNISIVRAANLTRGTIAGDFEAEVLKAGHAVVHDKLVVIDPMSDNATVITGSHNLGYKASYENDENMVIVEGDKSLCPRLCSASARRLRPL